MCLMTFVKDRTFYSIKSIFLFSRNIKDLAVQIQETIFAAQKLGEDGTK